MFAGGGGLTTTSHLVEGLVATLLLIFYTQHSFIQKGRKPFQGARGSQ